MPGETVQSDTNADRQDADRQDIERGLKLAAVAIVSALVTASVVIGVGEAWLSRSAAEAASPSGAVLIRTAG